MQLIVDPAADQVWQAVMTVQSAQGTVETVPTKRRGVAEGSPGGDHADRSDATS